MKLSKYKSFYLLGTGLVLGFVFYRMGYRAGEVLLYVNALLILGGGAISYFAMHAKLRKLYENPALAQSAKQEITALLERGDGPHAMALAAEVFHLSARDMPWGSKTKS